MKKILKKILSFFAILLALLPSLAFALGGNAANRITHSQTVNSTGNTAKIVIVQPENFSKGLVFNSQNIKIESCGFLKNSNSNIVQDQAILNLNQPASCFELVYGQAPRITKTLEVRPLARLRQKVVSLTALNFSSEHLKVPSGARAQMPVSPLPVFVFLLVLAAVDLSFKVQKKLVKINPAFFNVNLERLQVLRCWRQDVF